MTDLPKITNVHPGSWKGLQEEVARILRECGFRVEEPLTIATARGTVEIDVFAEEVFQGRSNKILCECKYWKSGIPKNVVHGFRTVMGDVGANTGYIIASKGFQSGAGPAADFTNVKLVTWDEFQETFELAWLGRYWVRKVDRLWRLSTWFADEDGGEDIVRKVGDKDKDPLRALFDRYFTFAYFVLGLWSTSRDSEVTRRPELPLSAARFKPDGFPPEIMEADSYRSFLLAAENFALAGARELHGILDRNGDPQAAVLARLLSEPRDD